MSDIRNIVRTTSEPTTLSGRHNELTKQLLRPLATPRNTLGILDGGMRRPIAAPTPIGRRQVLLQEKGINAERCPVCGVVMSKWAKYYG